jgi:hypothetical protein
MKVPSTGNFQPPSEGSPAAEDPGRSARKSRTQASVDGAPSPRLPHERDESSDSGTGSPSDVMHIAHDDAESDKRATDKSLETNAAYDSLRSRVPGKERDRR